MDRAHRLDPSDIRDEAVLWRVAERRELADCKVFQVWEDAIAAPDGENLVRGYLHHPGAVAVVALRDDDHVAVVRQYRHPVGMRMVELPAGLLDHDDEDPLLAAARELAEEAQLAADDWRVLVDHTSSAGSSEETVRIYLARGLRATDRPDGFVVEGEEAEMDVAWAAVDDLVDAVLAGRIQNGLVNAGVMAMVVARTRGSLDDLRPGDAPWPARDAKAVLDDAHVAR